MSGDVKENPEKIGKLTTELKMNWNHIKIKKIDLNIEESIEKDIQDLISEIKSGESILIHCQNGNEKSGIFLYHLLLKMELDSEKSLELLKKSHELSYQSVQKLLSK